MFIGTELVETQHKRPSKTGLVHVYIRKKTLALFRCDNCDADFKRELKKVDRKRLNNNYFHCCSNCDPKRFGQRKGVEQKKIWDLLASTTLPVGKY